MSNMVQIITKYYWQGPSLGLCETAQSHSCSPIDLNELRAQAGLSNKKWNKALKDLTKNKLAKVEKTDMGLLVSLV